MENNKRMKDFVSSIVMLLLSVFVLAQSYGIYKKAGKLLYLSPGLIPMMLGTILLVLSIVLLIGSLKDGGVAARTSEIKSLFKELKEDPNTMRMLIGVVLMGLYTFVMLGLLPFWIATFIFMMLLMYFLEAGSIPQIVVISAIVTALIILLFQVCFRVPLP